jgi:hypothetical protein
MKDALKIG